MIFNKVSSLKDQCVDELSKVLFQSFYFILPNASTCINSELDKKTLQYKVEQVT